MTFKSPHSNVKGRKICVEQIAADLFSVWLIKEKFGMEIRKVK